MLEHLGGPYLTVVDVGGSVGAFAEACVRRWPEAQVFSFEPLLDIASENARRADGRWTTLAYALAEKAGSAIMSRNLGSHEASTLLQPGSIRREAFGLDDRYEKVLVSVRTLDQLVRDYVRSPALLKIDVEGAELKVLNGGRETLPRFDTVVIELNADPRCFVGAPAPERVSTVMAELGFRYVGARNELRDPRDQTLLQADGIWKR